VIHTRNDPDALASAVRAAVWSVDKDQPVYDIQTMQARISEDGGHRRTQTILLTAFGLLAMCLAAVGIYGIVSEAVNQRTREIGVRMALGAEAKDVVRMVMRRSLALALAGIAVGLAASLYLTRFIRSLLFGVKATDALAFAGAAVVLMAVALLAGYLPARRASHIDPAAVLRSE
jgi:putative ABC transport system permease protein